MTNWNGTWFTGGIQVREVVIYCPHNSSKDGNFTVFPTGPLVAWGRVDPGFAAYGNYTAQIISNGTVRAYNYNHVGVGTNVRAIILGV